MARNKAFDPEEKLKVARDLFREKGYNATSLKDLVQTTGLNPTSLYDTYGDKHTLFLQCLSNYATCSMEQYEQLALGERSPLKTIESIVAWAVEDIVGSKSACMVTKSAFELCSSDKNVRAIIRKQNRQLSSLFRKLAQQALELGELDKDKDPALVADLIVAHFSGLWTYHLIFNDKEQVRSMSRAFMSLIRR